MPDVLAELVAKITADATELKRGLAESEKDIQGLGKTLEKETKSWQEQFKVVSKLALGMGASITAAMTGIIMSFTKAGSELHDLSLKTGMSVKALAGLKYAAEQNGASLGTVEMAIKRTAIALEEARDSTSGTSIAFNKLGISVTDLQGLNIEEQFLKLANAVAGIPDQFTRMKVAQDLFGRSGLDMLPMLSQGADGLKRMMEQGQKLSYWNEITAGTADALGDAFHTLFTSMGGLFTAIATSFAPTITDLIDKITTVVGWVKDWIAEHPELVKWLGLAALAVGGFLTFVGTLGLILPPLVGGMTALNTVTMTLTGSIIGLKLSFWELTLLAATIVSAIALASYALYALYEIVLNIVRFLKGEAPRAILSFTGFLKAAGEQAMGFAENLLGLDDIIKKGTATQDAAAEALARYKEELARAAEASRVWAEATQKQTAAVQQSYDALTGTIKLLIDRQRLWASGGGGGGGGYGGLGGYWRSEDWEEGVYAWGGVGPPPGGKGIIYPGREEPPGGVVEPYQRGGIVTKPTLAMLGESGAEAVIPLNEAGVMGGITINFTQPVFFDREDTLHKFVDMIAKVIQRQYRLKFGGAYSG